MSNIVTYEQADLINKPSFQIRRKKGWFNKINLIGMKFGRLTIVSKVVADNAVKKMIVRCECSCGKIIDIHMTNLIHTGTRSCGCLSGSINKMRSTHNRTNTSEYHIWASMKARCFNEKSKYYHHYGGRGITVCDSWIDSFEQFFNDMGARPSMRHSLDRINVDGDYKASNCRWATTVQQANNTRSNRYLTYQGVTKTIAEWGRQLGINRHTIQSRLNRGNLDIAEVLSTKIRKNQFDEYD